MKINYLLVTLLLFTFFTISFITNLLAPLFPALIESYDIGLALAGFFAFAFFIAYGVMSIPAGLLVQQFGEKKIMQLAFLLALIGSVIFVTMPTFFVAMLALFLIGCAMAMLQVAINPLLRASGGAHNFAVLSVAAQLMFGLAASISPLVYSHIAGSANRGEKSWLLQWVPENMSWPSKYLIFALLCAVMLVAVSLVPMAKKADDNSETLHLKDSLALLKDRTVIKFFFAIAAYVAIEQGRGELDGLQGGFVLQHFGTMDKGQDSLILKVVPDSGTDELAGLTGSMKIRIEQGIHHYDFEYML